MFCRIRIGTVLAFLLALFVTGVLFSNVRAETIEQGYQHPNYFPRNGHAFPKSMQGKTAEDIQKRWQALGITKKDLQEADRICSEPGPTTPLMMDGCSAVGLALYWGKP